LSSSSGDQNFIGPRWLAKPIAKRQPETGAEPMLRKGGSPMHSQENRNTIKAAAIILVAVLSTVGAWAQTGTVLYSFTGQPDGAYPHSSLLLDPKGNLFGTTNDGGAYGLGSVYELTPNPNGGWTESVIYSFNYGAGGYLPAANVIRDAKGNLYSTVFYGGAYGAGAVFELTRNKKTGVWTEQVIYSFQAYPADGGQPSSGLTFDKAGNLYGVTGVDGAYGQGVVYELSPNGSGGWTETVLHNFISEDPQDGDGPSGSLVMDKEGNLYGMTVSGGSAGMGTVFEVSPNGNGGWTESLLYSFLGGNDGTNPVNSTLLLKGTTLYGTTNSGGSANDGTIFELTYSKTKAQWLETVLYTFPGGANGAAPYAGLVADPKGNLYGTTTLGVYGEGGPVFELVKGPKKTWTEQVLYTDFRGSYAGLVRDKAGTLYGTSEFYGPDYDGAVFEVTP
jgi:uncharacterized repeat protein (TIGR03803 family)